MIPEEAELLIPLLQNAKDSPTYLLTYSAPVTRKMLHFNELNFYTIPSLPFGWEAPIWRKQIPGACYFPTRTLREF